MTLSSTLTDRAAGFLDRKSSRRGFLSRTAIVGSALTVAGPAYVMRPGTAYAAVCSCLGRSCNCTDLCCDGYTEFCCQIYGQNSCPADTLLAGWWKVDNSSFCDGSARYYMDCNKRSPNCGCGSAGVCRGSDTTCQCRNCGNRKDGCTRFRYGNCNNQVACVGPIMCRVVTCTKPWEIDPGCTTVARTDNNTRFHHRPCLDPPPPPPTAVHFALAKAFYNDYLQRPGTLAEHTPWAKRLAGGTSATAISDLFARSEEYVRRVVNDLYLEILERPGDQFGVGVWTQQIKAGKLTSTVASQFYASDEFFATAGSVGGYVDALYAKILDRSADASGRQHWIDKIESGTSRTTVAAQFYGSKESRQSRVIALYQRFLQRDPDPGGLQTWTTRLSDGDDLALATFLSGSTEYRNLAQQRFPSNDDGTDG